MANTKWYFINDDGDVQVTYDINSLLHTGYRQAMQGLIYDPHWRRKDVDRISSIWIKESEVPQLILMAYLIGV